MILTINGEEKKVGEGLTVAGLLGELAVKGPVAVELNRTVCRKKDHAGTALKDGDVLEIVTIVGGG